MQLSDYFLAQIEREKDSTRRLLSRVPQGQPDWKPHEKSMPLGYLATLVATMPSWFESMVKHAELDVAPADGSKWAPTTFETAEELVALFDASFARGKAALEGATNEHLHTTWRMLAGGHVVAEFPRHQVIADTISHFAHHRGQLTVYLRLNEVPVPCIYGPTADERGF